MAQDLAAAPQEWGRPRSTVPADVFAGLPAAAWRAAWDSSPALITVIWGPDQLLAYQNGASQELFGTRHLGLPLDQAFPELGSGRSEPLDRVMATGETVQMPPHLIDVRDVTGEEVALSYVLAPIGAPPAGVVITAIDVTAQLKAQQAAERTQLLADITNAVTSAPDAAAGLRALTDALVPAVADLAAVYVISEGKLEEGPPLPPEVLTIDTRLQAIGPPPPAEDRGPSPYGPLLRSGSSVLIPVDDEAGLAAAAPRPESAAWLKAAEARNLAAVPLVVAGTLTGVMVLLATGERRPFQASDLPFMEDVAARAGSAILALRTSRRQRDTAVDLQRSLLPPPPTGLPGVTAAARYLAGAADVEVGGDWWDVHDTGGGRLALGIGDVSGRGIPAAAVMGQLRAVMRAAGHARLSPVEVLHLLDAQLAETLLIPDRNSGPATSLSGRSPVRFATACYGIVDLDRLTLSVANAGHLPVLVRSAEGAVRRVEAPSGAPLGIGVGGFVEVTESLQPGDTLVLYTDGLVESRSLDIDDGLAMLSDALAGKGAGDVESVADELLDAMAAEPGHAADDVALVVVRIDPR